MEELIFKNVNVTEDGLVNAEVQVASVQRINLESKEFYENQTLMITAQRDEELRICQEALSVYAQYDDVIKEKLELNATQAEPEIGVPIKTKVVTPIIK